jgi:hypothetical protein
LTRSDGERTASDSVEVRTRLRNRYQHPFLLVLGILLAGVCRDSQACNVPAFRYALERWPADLYQIQVYHETAPLGDAFELLLKGAGDRAANYSLQTIDVTSAEGKALAQRRNLVAYPWVEIFYPVDSRIRTPVWSGPLTSDQVNRMLDSPTRTRLARQLLAGDVAVWILLKSGHEGEDRSALQSLKTHLERASATLMIPEIGTDLDGNPIEVDDFKAYPVRFSLIEVARDDPKEALLVSALLNSEPDLGEYDEPMAFPVFGRGRMLYALVGSGIQEKTILEACQSMLDWCSCEIKALNPGTDLLISADWSEPFGGRMVEDPELPALTGLDAFRPHQEAADAPLPSVETVPAEPAGAACPAVPATNVPVAGSVPIGERSEPGRPDGDPLARNLFYLAGGAGLVLVILSVLVTVRRKR